MSTGSTAIVLPPGPRLPFAVQSYLMWDRPARFLAACRRRYGSVFTVRAAPLGTMVYVTEPDAIRAVFSGSPEVFRAGEANHVLGAVLGERSVLVLDGEDHMAERKRMLPMFHGDAVARYTGVVESIVEAEVASWPRGGTLALHPRMRAITLETILRAVLGVDDEQRLAALRRALPALVDLPGWALLQWVRPELGRIPPWKRHVRRRERAAALLLDEVARRRRDPALGERVDILSLLLRTADADDELMRDRVMTLLLAGHETTATGLSWAFERLVRHPAAMERAREGDDDYLDAVVKETLRVRPVIVDVARTLASDADVAGHRLRAGTTVMPGIALVQRDERLWPHADEFRPERFLESAEPAPAYAWIPFGGGVRRCLGAAFAQQEMRLALRGVLSRVRLAPVDRPEGERARVRHITLVPARGARVTVS